MKPSKAGLGAGIDLVGLPKCPADGLCLFVEDPGREQSHRFDCLDIVFVQQGRVVQVVSCSGVHVLVHMTGVTVQIILLLLHMLLLFLTHFLHCYHHHNKKPFEYC